MLGIEQSGTSLTVWMCGLPVNIDRQPAHLAAQSAGYLRAGILPRERLRAESALAIVNGRCAGVILGGATKAARDAAQLCGSSRRVDARVGLRLRDAVLQGRMSG